MLGLLLLLNIVDYLLTVLLLSYGALELNPLLRIAVGSGVRVFSALKLGLLPLSVVLLLIWLAPYLPQRGYGALKYSTVGMAVVVLWNIVSLVSWRLL